MAKTGDAPCGICGSDLEHSQAECIRAIVRQELSDFGIFTSMPLDQGKSAEAAFSAARSNIEAGIEAIRRSDYKTAAIASVEAGKYLAMGDRLIQQAQTPSAPAKKTLLLKARRVSPKHDRVYEFMYPEIAKRYADKTNERGIPFATNDRCSVYVDPRELGSRGKGILPFRIIEHDSYAGPGGAMFPVLFEVFEFDWITEKA